MLVIERLNAGYTLTAHRLRHRIPTVLRYMYLKTHIPCVDVLFTGQVLAIASNDGTLKMYTVATGEVRANAMFIQKKKLQLVP